MVYGSTIFWNRNNALGFVSCVNKQRDQLVAMAI